MLETEIETEALISSVGADYRLLRDLLASGKWQEADLETSAIILQAAGREHEGWLTSESLAKFPCLDLQTIDKLWIKYSQGHFGFSVQKRIYFEVGENFALFSDRVGWRVRGNWLNYSEHTFNLIAPIGHLPSGGVGYKRRVRLFEAGYAALAHRVAECIIC